MNMRKILCLAIGLMACQTTVVVAQPAPPTPPPSTLPSMGHEVPAAHPAQFQQRLNQILVPAPGQEPPLTRFDLDFQGGPPDELVKEIEKATGKPLNAIIRPEDALTELPPLKMKSITLPQLFDALEVASERTVKIPSSSRLDNSYSTVTLTFGFKTKDGPSDNAIWYFYATKLPELPSHDIPKICQYYSLSSFLDRGFTVDDITTAIQAGWKMSGINPTPELNYHKETQMLIAYGEPDRLLTIQQVLSTLPSANADYWSKTQDKMKNLQAQVDNLQAQITILKQQVAAPAGVPGVPAEKTGK